MIFSAMPTPVALLIPRQAPDFMLEFLILKFHLLEAFPADELVYAFFFVLVAKSHHFIREEQPLEIGTSGDSVDRA